MIDPRLIPYGTTLADPNPLAPSSLVQQPGAAVGGVPQIPTGTVETTHEPSKEFKAPSAETMATRSAMDTAQQEKLNATDELAKADIAKEQAAADAAAKQAKIAEEAEAKRQALQKAEDDRRAQEAIDRAKALDEFEKASKVTTLWQDMTPLRRFISAIAVGMGQYASTMGGGPNTAYQIFRDQEEAHRRAQEANIQKATQKVLNQTKNAETARKFFDESMDRLDKTMLARTKVVDLQLAAVEKSIPQAAARAAQARAQNQIEYEKDKRNYLAGYDTTVKETGTSTQTSSGGKIDGNGVGQANMGVQETAINAQFIKNAYDEMAEIAKKSPKAVELFAKVNKEQLESGELEKSGGRGFIHWLRGTGNAPITIDQRISKAEADPETIAKTKRLAQLMPIMVSAKARQLDDKGAMTDATLQQGFNALGIPTMTPEQLATAAEEFSGKQQNVIDAANSIASRSGVAIPGIKPTQAQVTGKVGSPIKAKPQPKVPDARSDYEFIKGKLDKDSEALDPQRKAAFDEAIAELKKPNGDKAKAARVLNYIRNELPRN